MKEDTVWKLGLSGFGCLWVVGALLSLSTAGLVVYILYRVATHPW